MREATAGAGSGAVVRAQVSIRASREGGDERLLKIGTCERDVSIRASREGGDIPWPQAENFFGFVSIRASREGGDIYFWFWQIR